LQYKLFVFYATNPTTTYRLLRRSCDKATCFAIGGDGGLGGVGTLPLWTLLEETVASEVLDLDAGEVDLGVLEEMVALEVLDLSAGEEDLEVLDETLALEVLDASSQETVALAPSLETQCFSLTIEQ
jgi:hypothetical protein